MAEESVPTKRLSPRHYWLLRGESIIASVGISVAAILMAAMAASGWWTLRTEKEIFVTTRVDQVRALGQLLSQSAESMLASGDLSALRRMMLDAERSYNLSDCQIAMPNGKVVASSDPARITQVLLPERWSSTPMDTPTNTGNDHQMVLSFPLRVIGRGAAVLQLSATVQYPLSSFWEAQTGVGLIGAVGLLAVLVVYRRTRTRLLTLGVIREALLAVERGETSPDAVTISHANAPEAMAWNKIVTEAVTLKQKSVSERTQATLGGRREASGALDRACDAMPQGMIIIDEQGRIAYLNGAAAVILAARREDLMGKIATEVISDEPVRAALAAASSGTARGRRTVEVERAGQEGNSVLRFGVRPGRRDNAYEVVITIDDITQQRVAETSRNAFVTQAAHELRTPLTNIRLYVETALDEGEHDAAVRSKSLNVINQETRRLEIMIGEMLSVSEIEAGSLKITKDDVRLESLFPELRADYQAQADEKKIAMAFELPPKLPVIQADRDKFVLALHNLIGNALKYTPAGGKVTVAVRHEDKQLVVDVSDTGIGIDPKETDRIFERFYRSKDPRVSKITGTGLGLTLAREVVRQHGGEITVQSQPGVGSTFTMTLPVAADAA